MEELPIEIPEGVTPSLESARELFPPLTWGPTWRRGNDNQFILPEYTLGWECLRWCAENLVNEEGQPWMFTAEQARFALWFYATRPPGELNEDGEYGSPYYPYGILQRLKGWGKDPFAACVCLFELLGPCRFDRYDDSVPGRVVGKPHPAPWIQIVGVAKDQTKNTMFVIPGLLPKATRKKYALEVQKELIQIKGFPNKRIEVVASAPPTLQGNRPSFALCNEIHHWTPSRSGPDLWEVLKNGVDKNKWGGRLLAITNAFQPGTASVAETVRDDEKKVLEGEKAFAGFLYDSLEANDLSPTTQDWAPFILRMIRGDSVWLKINPIVLALQSTTVSLARLRRFWYNQVTSAEDALFTEGEWDMARVKARPLEAGDSIVLGFDGGKTDDATALVAIRMEDKVAFPIHIWQRPDGVDLGDWQVSPDEVDSWVRGCFRKYKVLAFAADVHPWESYIHHWGEDFKDDLAVTMGRYVVGYDMRGSLKEITFANMALMNSLKDGTIFHSGDALMRRHALNARIRENGYGISFGKEEAESPNKVDAYAALLLAYIALTKYQEHGKKPEPVSPFKGLVIQQ